MNLDLASFIPHTRNVLLLRDPVHMLASFGLKMEASLEETGYPELLQLYSTIEALTGQPPIVIDADQLQAHPEGVLRALCDRLGIPFYPAQLSWPAGPKPEVDGVWAAYWYADGVWKTTGFLSSGHGKKDNTYRAFPPYLFPLLRMCLPFYQALLPHALSPCASTTAAALPPPRSPQDEQPVRDHGLVVPSTAFLAPEAANQNLLVWVGDRLVPREQAGVSVFDSAVQGGDAVWEGLRVYEGRVLKLDAHLQRMHDSAKAMDFQAVPSKAAITRALFSTLAANGMRDGVHVRLTLTRGKKTTSSMNPTFNVFGCTLIVLAEHKPVGYVCIGVSE